MPGKRSYRITENHVRRRSYLWIESLETRLQLTALPAGFSETLIAQNIGSTTAMDLLSDGRVLVATQNGDLRVIKNGSLLATPMLHIAVDSSGERGLVGVTHDPGFATNHFIYVYHTVPANGAAAPFNEVSRFTVNGDVVQSGTQLDILKLNDLSSATNHNGGAMHFGTDGMLYIGVGENANPANSQTLSNLLGKILRLNVSTLQAGDPINDVAKLVPGNNPFVSSASGINQLIYALGFRNPFTFSVQPGTGTIFVDDVGQNTWEEIDKLQAGGNYGWNKSEGFASPNPPTGLGPGTYHDPQLAYNHSGGPAGGGIAITGGVFYNPSPNATNPFPSSYLGKYFYQDLSGNFMRLFNPATPGSLANPDTSSAFATTLASNPVDLTVAGDGSLYYLARGDGGALLKIAFTNSSKPTITQQPASITVTLSHPATFTVTASGSGPLSYQWQRENSGASTFTNITGATTSSYTLSSAQSSDNNAKFRVIVSNTAGSTTSNAATLTVTANHAPTPTITITSGLRNGKFDAGKSIAFTLSATDVEDGTEPASRFTYSIDYITSLNSTPGGVTRPFVAATSGKSSATFTPATSGPYTLSDVLYRIHFTATDANGLSATTTRDISPNTTTITLNTSPSGLKLNVDGQSKTAPTSFSSVVGFTRLLDAPATQTLNNVSYAFKSWSDAGARSHNITTPTTNATYTANYKATSTIRIEAETLTLSNYVIESHPAASAGKLISLKNGKSGTQTGTATGTFHGPTGSYTIIAGYFDENDGVSPMSLTLGGNKVASWLANQNLGNTGPDPSTHVARNLGTFQLTEGESFVLGGTSNQQEFARWDYIEFVPT